MSATLLRSSPREAFFFSLACCLPLLGLLGTIFTIQMTPPTTSELIFSEQANHNFSRTLGEIKRSTLSIRNRLHSIQQDAAFAQKVAEAYGRPLIANERCGSWYIDPRYKGGSAYFKSTDGHTGVWKFSLRRLNLHLLEIIRQNDGWVVLCTRCRPVLNISAQVHYCRFYKAWET